MAPELIDGMIRRGIDRQDDEECNMIIRAYGDASFAPQGGRSHSGSIVMLSGGPVSWRSGRQQLTAESTCEAELIAQAENSHLGLAVLDLLQELGEKPRLEVFSDNRAVILMVAGGSSWRTRHFKIKAMALRDRLDRMTFVMAHLPGAIMPADGLTKALSVQAFVQALKHMQLSYASIGGAAEKFSAKTMNYDIIAEAMQKTVVSMTSRAIESVVEQLHSKHMPKLECPKPVECEPCVQIQVHQGYSALAVAAVTVGAGVVASGLTAFMAEKKTKMRDSNLQTVVTYRTDRFKFLGPRAADDMCSIKNETTVVEDMNWCCRRRRRRRE
jgi:hypothetical protein